MSRLSLVIFLTAFLILLHLFQLSFQLSSHQSWNVSRSVPKMSTVHRLLGNPTEDWLITPHQFRLSEIESEKVQIENMLQISKELKSLPEPFRPSTSQNLTRGIALMCSGRYFTMCLFNLRMIREILNIALPVEIWMGSGEMTIDQRERLRIVKDKEGNPPTIRFVQDIANSYSKLFGPTRWWTHNNWQRNFHFKVMALFGSKFVEVLLLDEDNVLLRNPLSLYESTEFIRSGALFWPDIYMLPKNSIMWDIFGLKYKEMWAGESGAVLLDRSRCISGMMLLAQINQHQDFFYKITYYDKDTFIYAWMIAGCEFYQIPWSPLPIGQFGTNGLFCGHSIGQSDTQGRIMFVHMTHNKKLSKHLHLLKYFDPEKAIQTHTNECFDVTSVSSSVNLLYFSDIIGNFNAVADYLLQTV